MTVPGTWWRRGFLAVGICALSPVVLTYLRGSRAERCEFDGAPLDPRFRVRFVLSDGKFVMCCGLWCAEQWLHANQTDPHEVWLVDEITGDSVSAERAVLVQSQVLSNPIARDYRHVFGDLGRANEHARRFRGRLIEGSERPFQFGD